MIKVRGEMSKMSVDGGVVSFKFAMNMKENDGTPIKAITELLNKPVILTSELEQEELPLDNLPENHDMFGEDGGDNI